MDKKTLKIRLREALEQEPLKSEIKKVSLFGSYINGQPRPDSDIDVLIEFLPTARIGFFKFIGIQENLEKFLGKKIDLLTPEALSKYFRSEVLKQAETIYEK